jgi:hypothetical protein
MGIEPLRSGIGDDWASELNVLHETRHMLWPATGRLRFPSFTAAQGGDLDGAPYAPGRTPTNGGASPFPRRVRILFLFFFFFSIQRAQTSVLRAKKQHKPFRTYVSSSCRHLSWG